MFKFRFLVGIVALLAFTGVAYAAAASLGGITTPTVGSSDAVVASCDTDGVTVAYETAYDSSLGTNGAYYVTAVDLSGVNAACNGLTADVTLSDGGSSAQSGSLALVASPGTTSIPVSPHFDAGGIDGVHIVIH